MSIVVHHGAAARSHLRELARQLDAKTAKKVSKKMIGRVLTRNEAVALLKKLD